MAANFLVAIFLNKKKGRKIRPTVLPSPVRYFFAYYTKLNATEGAWLA